ncbi:MAG: hypothetical protein ACLR9W_08085 [Enterobacter hormaechei]
MMIVPQLSVKAVARWLGGFFCPYRHLRSATLIHENRRNPPFVQEFFRRIVMTDWWCTTNIRGNGITISGHPRPALHRERGDAGVEQLKEMPDETPPAGQHRLPRCTGELRYQLRGGAVGGEIATPFIRGSLG